MPDPEVLPRLPDQVQVEGGVPYVDIESFEQFASLPTPDGWYWCEFFGGQRQYRCFLLPTTFRRAELLASKRHQRLLESSIMPVYSDAITTVRQDPTHAMPGFYIVAPAKPYFATDDLSVKQYLAMRFVDHEIATLMRSHLEIRDILRVNEERQVAFQNVHTWLMPMDAPSDGASLFDSSLLGYLLRYSSWRRYEQSIRTLNEIVRSQVAASRLRLRTEAVMEALSGVRLSPRRGGAPPSHYDGAGATSGVVYSHAGLQVMQDPDVRIPGALIITCDAKTAANECAAAVTYLRMRFVDYSMRIALRQVLGVSYAYKLQEARPATGGDLSPICILPINDIERYNRIYNFAIHDYIAEMELREQHAQRIPQAIASLRWWRTAVGLERLDSVLQMRLRSCAAILAER